MRAVKLLAVVTTALLIVSCGPALTLNPLFHESQLVVDPTLLGTWGDGETYLTFERDQGKTYKLTYRDGAKVSIFVAELGCLDGRMFLDIFPADKGNNPTDNEAYAPVVPMHTVLRIDIQDDQLMADVLDSDWVEKQLAEGSSELDAQNVLKAGDNLFLSLPTDKLQDLVRNHADDDEAFPPSDPLPQVE